MKFHLKLNVLFEKHESSIRQFNFIKKKNDQSTHYLLGLKTGRDRRLRSIRIGF